MTLIDIKEKREFNKVVDLGNNGDKNERRWVKQLILFYSETAKVR